MLLAAQYSQMLEIHFALIAQNLAIQHVPSSRPGYTGGFDAGGFIWRTMPLPQKLNGIRVMGCKLGEVHVLITLDKVNKLEQKPARVFMTNEGDHRMKAIRE